MNTNSNIEEKEITRERYFSVEEIQNVINHFWKLFSKIEDCGKGYSKISKDETSVRFEFKHGGFLSFSFNYTK